MGTEREQRETDRGTDRQLLSRFVAERDESAFREIVRRHGPLVLGVCRRVLGEAHEAEDAFQATFLVLARDARKIRRRKSLTCWLHGVAYRISLRVAKRKSRHMEPLLEDHVEDRPAVLEHIAHRHDQRMVDEELNKLPEKDRESLTMRYLEDLSNNEIAKTLEISVSAVEGRLKRAKDRLRRQLLRRGVTLSVFVGLLMESRIELQAVEPLVAGAVELGLSDAVGRLAEGSAAHELALTEIGEMAMTMKQVATMAAVAVLATGLGLYGLSGPVAGQEAAEIAVPDSAEELSADVKVTLVRTQDEDVLREVAGNRPKSGGPISPRLKSAQAIAAALNEEILLEFDDAPLSEVVDYLKTARKIAIVIDRKALDEVGMPTDTPVTVSLKGITLRSALGLMLDEMDLDYVIRNEVLMITTEEAAEEQLDPRVYVVQNLYTDNELDPDTLIELITSMIAPSSWEEVGGPGAISAIGSRGLAIAQTDRIHDQIADFLEKLKLAMSK